MADVPERTRRRAIARLQRGYATSALSTETFERRLDCALRAGSARALRATTSDIGVPSLLDRIRARLARRAPSGLLLEVADDRPKVLGRSPACDVVLRNDSVSRRHAMLVREDGRYVLTDLGSTNATYVNGRRVSQAEVVPGDELQLGEARLIL